MLICIWPETFVSIIYIWYIYVLLEFLLIFWMSLCFNFSIFTVYAEVIFISFHYIFYSFCYSMYFIYYFFIFIDI